MKIKERICSIISDMVNDNIYQTAYREPLIGFADADDPMFLELRKVAHPQHLMPAELLPAARTVVAYFIPFTKELLVKNRDHSYIAPSWSLAYVETNRLIGNINQKIKQELIAEGIDCALVPATHNFDMKTIMSRWSHRHIAYIAGLGTFGINNMLITEKGCGGRYGSFVIDAKVEPSIRPAFEYCLYKSEGKCGACMQLCPIGAITPTGFDREGCYDHVLEVLEHHKDIDPLCDVCGKCDTGQCAYING